MKTATMVDEKSITTLRINKRIRRKLGELINGNETLDEGLERILDKALKEK
jgi:hypothetical protein